MATKTVEIPTKFKTINNQEITGEGNITIEATGGMTQGASFWGGSFYQTSGSYRIYTITCSEEKRPLINDLVLDQSNGNVYKITSSSYYATATTYVRVRCSTTSSFSLKGATGNTPTISATATVSNTTGTPSVTVTKSGTTTNPSFKFAFSGLKGEPGESGSSSGSDIEPIEIFYNTDDWVNVDFYGYNYAKFTIIASSYNDVGTRIEFRGGAPSDIIETGDGSPIYGEFFLNKSDRYYIYSFIYKDTNNTIQIKRVELQGDASFDVRAGGGGSDNGVIRGIQIPS